MTVKIMINKKAVLVHRIGLRLKSQDEGSVSMLLVAEL